MASASRTSSYGRDQYDPALERTHVTAPAAVRRISWGAIIAGIVVTLVLQLLLALLGLAIGASTIDPAGPSGTPDATTFGTTTAIWWVITVAISTFAGAWVAARLAGMPTRTDSMLHGLVTWGAATLLGVYLLTSTIGGLLGGAFGILGNVASSLGSGVASVTQGAGSLAQNALQVLPDDVRAQAEGLFDQAQSQAPAVADQAQQQADQARQAAGGGSNADAIRRVVRGVQEGATPQDRQAAVNVIAQQSGIPPQEAEQRLTQFQDTYQQYTQRAAQEAREAADATANTVSQVSFWSVVALLLGAILSAVAGRMATPRDLRVPV